MTPLFALGRRTITLFCFVIVAAALGALIIFAPWRVPGGPGRMTGFIDPTGASTEPFFGASPVKDLATAESMVGYSIIDQAPA